MSIEPLESGSDLPVTEIEQEHPEQKKTAQIGQEHFAGDNSPFCIKKIKYEVSLLYKRLVKSGSWWTRIEPFNLYLGALPLANSGHLEIIVNLGVTHILSVVEDFELQEGWFNTPVKPEDWEAAGVSVKHIHAEDYCPLTHKQIEEGIAYLHQCFREGKTVYLHCKGGVGRSSSIFVAYLIKHHEMSFKGAFDFVKKQRPNIHLNEEQQNAILTYFEGVSKYGNPKSGGW
ncbi:dual specificity protein phosphatase family protein [Candidatus Neptunochlamydia vexilliferae]|uniref:Uncharacterized protein n=1 Tax=Candidatus Neptunichlamydia vexilliferae TaxID=1651774 RepID=A0ABS0B1W0_9BACT|nr:dual specificity protein phosphatase family protein [Candidatus Neptunochlamydia vexilliferae]MBF5059545.1 hypothetical protein [Candidatus Neptunochlamydia vexilliferae]